MTDHSTLAIRTKSRSSEYRIHIGSGLLSDAGRYLGETFSRRPMRAAVISNPTVADLYADRTLKSLEKAGFKTSLWMMKDGERFKSLASAEKALGFLAGSAISRTDVVVALGGGVVGDLAGFASSVYLRGIPYVQLPTTLLSMIDSSVGGKTGVNTSFGKNLVGSFYPPSLVIADIDTLKTLPRREITAGSCEAIKQGAIAGKALFSKTAAYLAGQPGDLAGLIHDQIAFKASIVRQDEFEDLERNDARSRKILNFGHTFAHALEKATNYRYFRHGEAVGYGIIFAATLSNFVEILDSDTLKLLNDVVHRAGRLPSLHKVSREAVLAAFNFDKKIVAGSLQWVLLAGIGKPVILPGSQIPTSAVRKTLTRFFNDM
jgi:3-dehydroquinate synthase